MLGHSNRLSFQEPGCPSNITSPRLSFHDPGCPSYLPPRISGAELDKFKRIIRSFSYNTAVAHDKLPPRMLEHLDDETLKELILFYKRVEHVGSWPQAWRVATMVMIPKAEAFKWRLIAMLVTPYRIWARAAGEDVSAWMSERLDR